MLYFQITIKEPHKKPKPRASFRMKKGISRKPLHATTKKEPIKPAENKASRLRAQKIQEAENTDTPRSRSGSHHKNIEYKVYTDEDIIIVCNEALRTLRATILHPVRPTSEA